MGVACMCCWSVCCRLLSVHMQSSVSFPRQLWVECVYPAGQFDARSPQVPLLTSRALCLSCTSLNLRRQRSVLLLPLASSREVAISDVTVTSSCKEMRRKLLMRKKLSLFSLYSMFYCPTTTASSGSSHNPMLIKRWSVMMDQRGLNW